MPTLPTSTTPLTRMTMEQERRHLNPLDDLDNVFRHHPPPDQDTIERYQRLREAGKQLALAIDRECPAGADRAAAMRKVREAVMTANAAIALE